MHYFYSLFHADINDNVVDVLIVLLQHMENDLVVVFNYYNEDGLDCTNIVHIKIPAVQLHVILHDILDFLIMGDDGVTFVDDCNDDYVHFSKNSKNVHEDHVTDVLVDLNFIVQLWDYCYDIHVTIIWYHYLIFLTDIILAYLMVSWYYCVINVVLLMHIRS